MQGMTVIIRMSLVIFLMFAARATACQVPTGHIEGKTPVEYLQNWLKATHCFSEDYIKEHFRFPKESPIPSEIYGTSVWFQFLIDGKVVSGPDKRGSGMADIFGTSNNYEVHQYIGPLKEYELKVSQQDALEKVQADKSCVISQQGNILDSMNLTVQDVFNRPSYYYFDPQGLRWVIPMSPSSEYLCSVDALNKKLFKLRCAHGFGPCVQGRPCPKKPVIYFYPSKVQEVSVKLFYQGKITSSYPEYDNNINGWKIMAYPDGHLVNLADNAEYSYLFWEGISDKETVYDFTKGFIVAGEDTAKFLQVILKKLGLTPKEYNEFIVYWLPRMKDNKYNLIHFAGKEYTDTARLDIQPKPDALLRVFMVYRPIDSKIDIVPQDIKPFARKGFTVVEWGGTELK